jgi:hypothetical protein
MSDASLSKVKQLFTERFGYAPTHGIPYCMLFGNDGRIFLEIDYQSSSRSPKITVMLPSQPPVLQAA